MTVTVHPSEFKYVFFDAAEIASVVEELLDRLGFDPATDVVVNVDETVPMGRARITSLDPITLDVESGALEDAKNLRHLSRRGSLDILGRLLLQVRDRRTPGFDGPSIDADLTLAERVAWAVHCAGRQAALGYPIQRQRRLYAFRTRHGFSDVSDAAFDQLWSGTDLSWADISRLSAEALAASGTVAVDA